MRPTAADAGIDQAVAQARRWYWMRISSMVLAVCVLVHLGTVVYAVRGGLSAAEILGRTRGSVPFAAFYVVFVVACAIHVPIGLEAIVREWLSLGPRAARVVAWVTAIAIALLGLRAVYAVAAA